MPKTPKTRIFVAALAAVLVLTTAAPAIADEADMYKNLAEGLSYTVMTGEPVEYSYGNYTEDGAEFDADDGQLTDSVTALSDGNSKGWYRSFRGKSRIVQFDLGSQCSVSSASAGFFHNSASGIYAPRYFKVFLSEDGEGWQCVYSNGTGFDLTRREAMRCDVFAELERPYAARYVRVEYSCDIIAYCDEITVNGYSSLVGDELSVIPQEQLQEGEYLKSIAGVSDIVKIYNGYYSADPEVALNTADEFLPYIAYLDRNGNIVDTLFDAVALVPCHTDYPSGGRLVKTGTKSGGIKSDWELYFDLTFGEGRDLYNLDEAVDRVFSALGREEKYGVFLTIPFPSVLEGEFGDIDGDGRAEYCRTLEERTAIVDWYVKKCVDAFGQAGYENLKLLGFYWYREEVNYSETDHEDLLIKNTNRIVDTLGLVTLFDPFYLSTGFDHWQELGFDGAVMQPNLAFRSDRDYFLTEMLTEFAQTSKKYGLGVEMETDEPSYFRGGEYLEAGKNFEAYLYYGALTGYMYAAKTYYQGAGPGTFFDLCYGDTSTPKGLYLRRLYELLYSFIKHSYSNTAPKAEVSDFEVVSGDRVTVDIVISDPDSHWGDVNVEFLELPLHGQVAVAATKKTLIYHADGDYSGPDSFLLVVTDGFSRSEEIRVNVTVAAQVESSVSAEGSLLQSDASDGQTDKKGGSALPYILAAVGCAVFLAGAILLKKRFFRK